MKEIIIKQCAWSKDIFIDGKWIVEKIALKTLRTIFGDNVEFKYTHGIREDILEKMIENDL
jgi:hypothetical protein